LHFSAMPRIWGSHATCKHLSQVGNREEIFGVLGVEIELLSVCKKLVGFTF
jgi:hypothetical protein